MVNTKKNSLQNMEQMAPLTRTPEKVSQKMTTCKNFKYIKESVTVEPTVALFMMTSIITMLSTQNLNIDKACRVNLEYNEAVCTALKLRQRENLTNEEDEVQRLVASVEGWKSVIHTAFPIILMMFIGAWSDRTGRRKICIQLPVAGELISCILNIINTYFYQASVEWTAFCSIIFLSLSGGWYTMFLGGYSYIVDITSEETRTYRLGVLSLGVTVAFPVGIGLSGIILRYAGYYGVFGIAVLIHSINFLYLYFYIEDHRWLENVKKDKQKGCVGFLVDFFNFDSLKETVQIVFKKGPNNRRLKICLILFLVCLTFGPIWGETSIVYIFCRYQFNWDEIKYSMYCTYSLILHTSGTMFSISFFSKKLKLDDSMLGIIAMTSKIAGALMWAFARNGKDIYVAPVLELLNGTIQIATRSITSKMVTSNELGKVYSLFGLAETIVPLIFSPMYSMVYITTLHILPGAPFLITVAASIPALFVFIWFYYEHKKDSKKTTQENEP
ncbi:proton-coupled folate transporter-like [Aricia agestis]|uniref:proton-coupled folate transporter-like n=1 Tax=Aricia agestis TaxID=91739 RepID=UPI001C20BB99|nr:proton-coupled folate transporter-like [Aricia agestis]XP_041976366.1 proton-coupled folate transporter-like [Aricia agestis]XP_041976367.1 proton-coupled folate transporter-like [Aricia agestis]